MARFYHVAQGLPNPRIELKFPGPTDKPRMLGRFGGYEIAGVIGFGGMGIVKKCY